MFGSFGSKTGWFFGEAKKISLRPSADIARCFERPALDGSFDGGQEGEFDLGMS